MFLPLECGLPSPQTPMVSFFLASEEGVSTSCFAALFMLPPTFNGCALLARKRAAEVAPAFCALLYESASIWILASTNLKKASPFQDTNPRLQALVFHTEFKAIICLVLVCPTHTHTYMYKYINIYLYSEREREKERERKRYKRTT